MTSKKKLNSVQGEIEVAGLGIQREKVVYPQLASVVERERERELPSTSVAAYHVHIHLTSTPNYTHASYYT